MNLDYLRGPPHNLTPADILDRCVIFHPRLDSTAYVFVGSRPVNRNSPGAVLDALEAEMDSDLKKELPDQPGEKKGKRLGRWLAHLEKGNSPKAKAFRAKIDLHKAPASAQGHGRNP